MTTSLKGFYQKLCLYRPWRYAACMHISHFEYCQNTLLHFFKKIYFTEKEVTKIELNRFHRKRQVNVLILLKETSTNHLLLYLTSRNIWTIVE